MRETIKIELIVYLATLAAIAVLMHPDLLSDPAGRLTHMSERQNYFHPFLYTFIIYLVLVLLRLTFKGIKKLIRR